MLPATQPPIALNIHDWNMSAQTNNSNTNNQNGGLWTSDVFEVGALYLSPSFNGGQGTVQRYLRDVSTGADFGLISFFTVDFSTGAGCTPGASPANPAGIFSEIQNQHLVLILSGGTNWPMTVKRVAVWQQTSTG